MKLASLVQQWDSEYEATLPVNAGLQERRPYNRLLDGLMGSASMRFEPYQNDELPNYIEKLCVWLDQFPDDAKRCAFLLAVNMLFVSQRQYEALQRRLFEAHIRRYLLDRIIIERGLAPLSYRLASRYLDQAMDESLFVANSDSSPLNSFVHVNSVYFKDRGKRHLTGPEIRFWVYPSLRLRKSLTATQRVATAVFEHEVLNSDPHLHRRKRLVIIEDFSGTGEDILSTLGWVDGSGLNVTEVLMALVMCTDHALTRIEARCQQLTKGGSREYSVKVALRIPEKLRCFDGPEPWFYSSRSPILDISDRLRALSVKIYTDELRALGVPERARHGYGALALAFAFYSNCPDNTLPMIWAHGGRWRALFPRASRYI